MNETSISLLDRACNDPGAESWERLASIYVPLLQVWIKRYGLQANDVDDVLQDVLLTVSRELAGFEHSGNTGAFRSWLRTILVHRLQGFWRSRNYRPTAAGGSSLLDQLQKLEDEASDASRIWNAEHDRHVLTKLMEQIRPRFQKTTWDAFRRQMFGGESAQTVAADLKMQVHTVYVAKSRVLHALRQEAVGLIDNL